MDHSETSEPQMDTVLENPETHLENTDVVEQELKHDPKDIKPKSPMEHWLKRQFPQHTLRGMVAAIEKMKAGVPVPYLAFFAREQTEGLKSSDLYRLKEALGEWEEVERKQKHLITEIQAQGKLTDELKLLIERSSDLDRLEDLYAPFKLKRQTLGVQARESGLAPLADYLWNKGHGIETPEIAGETLLEKALPFAKAESKFADADSVLKGVQDILVEKIAETFELRSLVRAAVFRRSKLKASKGTKAKGNSKYSKFFDYQEPIGSLKKPSASHRYLMIRKGWMEDELSLSFERPDEGLLLEKFEEYACPVKDSIGQEILVQAARLALKGSVFTVMENEAHRHLKEESEKHVIETFGESLRKKILRPGLGRKAVMGIDPGTANHPCSLALLDQEGKLLLQLPFKVEEVTDTGKQEFLLSLENLKIEAIAVAHGPRSKEIREGFKKILEEAGRNLPIVSVHEHTSSIYASSPAGKEEFPALDVNSRRAVFVARFLQDPMSMILRLEPKFLSLGEFQHEVNQGKLRAGLTQTMEGAVNFIGVDPNFAPAHVLAHVSGLDAESAKAIVKYRENAQFESREDLKKVPGLAAKFEHFAGFLRVMKSANRFDHTFIHPSHYEAVSKAAQEVGAADPFQLTPEQLEKIPTILASSLGETNAKNISYELSHESEDPRGKFEAFEYDASLKTLSDLKPNTLYPGVVTNVTSFGAFVDLGIEQDGLVHISELTDALAKNPFDSLYPGDAVSVFVTGVNEEKKQISLTMKGPARERKARPPRKPRAPREPREPRAEGEAAAPQQPPRPRRPYRGPMPSAEGQVARATNDGARSEDGEHRPRFRGREDRGNGPDRGDRGDRAKREEKDRKPKKPHRDPKTGAVVKLDDVEGRQKGGPKLPAKAKPHTFNPFANLADLLKDKQGKEQ
jgi:protein Tex